MTIELIDEIILTLLIAFLIDGFIGEPPNKIHPVVQIGKIIDTVTKFTKNISHKKGENFEKFMGSILAIGLPSMVGLIVYLISVQSFHILGTVIFIILSSIILKASFSIRAMDIHINDVITELDNHNLDMARKKLAKIVSRETSTLSESKILSACIECVAESFVDGVLSPLFYYGFLNTAGAMAYRTSNTLDSMIAYKEEYYMHYGWMAAKLDTIMNFVPARISPAFLIPAIIICRKDWKNAVMILKRDRNKVESFNAGIPMAIMAGGLNIQLEKTNHYKLGDMNEELSIQRCKISLKITKIAAAICVIGFVIPITVILNYLGWWNVFFGF
ncbi:cobalamin biosynthesis protein [Candidatus Nitrosocosmicus franklandus]|uniref:Probable cobalamin biosynthesis protein CobD n=1 Tax=Candidatus Nitrosocosmicus franklandianus TaxID=1798806 RepID=A0A484I8A9_9ARCH|nr:cobalamin biosynthesis protein [Candidatus Nitrosocosmicus franklandus]VFJ13336.1 putative cobalamin biosynthesis protein CobD [Candidatus Nitrosocosmicus franklandus]